MTTYPDRFGVRRLLDALTHHKARLTVHPDGTLIVRTCEPLPPAISQQLQEHGRELADLMRVWRKCVPSRANVADVREAADNPSRQWDHLDQQAAREGRALRTLDALRPRRRRHGEKRGKR